METLNCLRLAFLGVLLSCMLYSGEAKLKEGECEVCISVLDRFVKDLDSDVLKSVEAIEEKFQEFCKKAKGKDERFCYYIGGLETSATKILNKMSKPLSWHMPSDKICEKLKVADAQICDLKYEKQIDLSKVNLKKLKVKDLKKILSDWGEDSACKGCAEKSDFIRVVEELMPKYDPKAAQARKEEL